MDSDEEETFICIGNPVEQIEEDVPLKKPVLVQDLTVKDKKGRSRFHGAFTGGFSAGYFNSVGSKDGFVPAEFVSHRDQKSDSVNYKPEDFMDEEDFSEHGIAPRKLVTSDKFSTEERRKRRHDEGKSMMTGTVFEGTSALTDFILPEKLTIGIKLLKKMGWKQGHRIGSKRNQVSEPGQKIYGCYLPSQIEEEESDEDLQLEPKDVNPISFVAKDNVHGLGYSGLDPRSALPGTHINLFERPAVTKTGRKGIRGQAFGVGALEDPDDDIYSTDHMSNYDMTMEIEDTADLHGWTAPRAKHESKHLPIGYIGKVLEGFKLSDKTLHQKKVFPPPELPRHYKPVHVFMKPKESETDSVVKQSEQNAVTRGMALGEVGSVFDLVSSKDKDKINRFRKGHQDTHQSDKSSDAKDKQDRTSTRPQHSDQWLVLVQTDSTKQSEPKNTPLFQGGSLSFKPFIKDERKQARYEKYLNLVKFGSKDAYEQVTEGHMTEWERDHEKEEFIKAAKMYKPLAGMIASRFTRAKFDDAEDTVEVPAEEGGDKDDRAKAAEMKMYGRLTRDEFKWYPDKLLCRRFNVPDPYPGSGIVGLPTVKKDKYSVFNFLTFPSSETTEDQQDQEEEPQHSTTPSSSKHENIEKESHKLPSRSHDRSTSAHEHSSRSHDSSSKSHGHSSKTNSGTGKPVSIFSHLVKQDKQKQPVSSHRHTDSEQDKSKSRSSQLPGDDSSKQVVEMEGEKKNEATESSKTTEEKPPMDLFSAIFGNTDSEDSDEESEQTDKPSEIQTSDPTVTPVEDSQSDDMSQTREPQYLPGAPVVIETIENRLSPKVPEETLSYGPMPPSSSVLSSRSVETTSLLSSRDYLDPVGQRKQDIGDFADPSLLPDRNKHRGDSHEHRKHKHSKHKHKKDKKSKHKKSKHKKKDKKRKKKYSDSDDTDESSSDEDIPTDKELLQKLKSLPKGKYLI